MDRIYIPSKMWANPLKTLMVWLGWDGIVILIMTAIAIVLRLWELDSRTMHYDESLHVHYAWRLAQGEGYSHSPWMHGPFQIHVVAAIFKLLGDNDFTARVMYALFGSGLVGLTLFLRPYWGRVGSIATSLLLAISPSLLYFSRFGRNDILMVFWALALFICMWNFFHSGKNRYLYITAAILACMFTTKETSYIQIALFSIPLFLMALRDFIPWILGRTRLSDFSNPSVYLLLIATLTLPQWSALSILPLKALGFQLINEGVGEVGMPLWGGFFVQLPLIDLHYISVGIASLGLATAVAIILYIYPALRPWKWVIVTILVTTITAWLLLTLLNENIPLNYLISFLVLLGTFFLSIWFGVFWKGKVWIYCAAIFYSIWTVFYTGFLGLFGHAHGYCPTDAGPVLGSLCQKLGGLYTGSWQSLAYWIAQQEVARGGQPWYYHITLLSIYEFLPMVVGTLAILYYLRKVDLVGIFLSYWAVFSLIGFSIASEKMPWLIINYGLPFILLTGKFVGDTLHQFRFKETRVSVSVITLILSGLLLGTGMILLVRLAGTEPFGFFSNWMAYSIFTTLSLILVFITAINGTRFVTCYLGVGLFVISLVFTIFVSIRSNYVYDDSNLEMLVYAQGSYEIQTQAGNIQNILESNEISNQPVEIDYEIWYPMNWYVRYPQMEGSVIFKCYKDDTEAGYVDWCSHIVEPPEVRAILLNDLHSSKYGRHLDDYEKSGPFSNLLWFPENYRRERENRREESFFEEVKYDSRSLLNTVSNSQSWKSAINYFVYRNMSGNWWNSKFFFHSRDL